MSDFKGPWAWDDKVWEECDPMQRAPWLIDAAGNPVLKGEIRCASEDLANLIEAAPDLLEALQALRLAREQDKYSSWEKGVPEFSKAEALADAALAKALGGKS